MKGFRLALLAIPMVMAQEEEPLDTGTDPFYVVLVLFIAVGFIIFFLRYRQNPAKTREEIADFIARLKGEKREHVVVQIGPQTTPVPEQFKVERELIEQIKHLQFAGKKPPEIVESLRRAGWDERVIQDAFRHLKI